jgi:hypothetical protein
VLLSAAIIAASLAWTGTAEARFFSIRCAPGMLQQVDPLVQPGVTPSAHQHLFFANQSVTADATTTTMLASTVTTCDVAADTAGIWMPAPTLAPKWIADYWTSVPRHTVEPWPTGLFYIAGDAHATQPPPENTLFWNCGTGQTANWTTPQPCPVGNTAGLNAHLVYPNCWDGTGLQPADLSYPVGYPATFAENPPGYPCPAAYPHLLPVLQEVIHFGVVDPAQLAFSSGAYWTLHVDYWQTDQPTLAVLVDECLNHGVGCGAH